MKFIELTDQQKTVLLDFLGFAVKDGIVYSKKDNKPHICPYTGEPVKFDEASVMPGSTVVFNTNALTLAEYFSEHVEDGEIKCQRKAGD